jgi:hypothetical protein
MPDPAPVMMRVLFANEMSGLQAGDFRAPAIIRSATRLSPKSCRARRIAAFSAD